MAGHGCGMFKWSWIEASVLGSQVYGQASVEGCEGAGIKTLKTSYA